MIILDVFIPHKIKSGNAFTSGRGAMWIKKAYRREWGDYLRAYTRPGPWWVFRNSVPPAAKIYGKYIRYMDKGERTFDDDNMRQGTKLIRDCLKPIIAHATKRRPRIIGLGWIFEDNQKWHEYECRQVKMVGGTVGLKIILSTEKI
jgi:hypothetical protein